MTGTLSDLERGVLEMERRRYKFAGAKEGAVLAELGLTYSRYYAILNSLLDLPAAEAEDPLLVRRLRRLRDQRKAQRTRTRRAGHLG